MALLRKVGLTAAGIVLLAAGTARAEILAPPTQQLSLGEGYCQYLSASAAAHADQLLLPEAFATYAVLNVGENNAGEIDGTPRPRFQAGLAYNLADLWRGLEIRHKANAECQRFRAEQSLHAALDNGGQLGAVAALKARVDELDKAMPEAEQMIAGLQTDVREARATVEELNVAQLRLDTLRQMQTQARVEMDTAAARPQLPPGQTLTALLVAYRRADDRVESATGGLRSAEAWDLKLRGGYDDVVGIHEKLPLFGVVTLSYKLGALFGYAANAEARQTRVISRREDVQNTDFRIGELSAQLRSTYHIEQGRLKELDLTLGDLQAQYDEVKVLQTSLVRRYQDYLWFEITRMRAEQAYLNEHTKAIKAFLGDDP